MSLMNKGKRKTTKGKKEDVKDLNIPTGDYIQKDWNDREWMEKINTSIRDIVSSLNKFESSTRHKLTIINTKIELLERQTDYLLAKCKSFEAVASPPSQKAEPI